jgi:HTH-type transcriptional regulator / antitoxin HigA
MKSATARRPRVRDDYLELVRRFPLRPIRNDTELDEAFAVLDKLVTRTRLSPGESDYLEALTHFVERYEDEHHRIDLSHLTGLDLLKSLLEENSMNASDLGRLLGNRQLGSAVLRGNRQLSKTHIRKLCERFRVSADLFL